MIVKSMLDHVLIFLIYRIDVAVILDRIGYLKASRAYDFDNLIHSMST